jgi:hypothetical protein
MDFYRFIRSGAWDRLRIARSCPRDFYLNRHARRAMQRVDVVTGTIEDVGSLEIRFAP